MRIFVSIIVGAVSEAIACGLIYGVAAWIVEPAGTFFGPREVGIRIGVITGLFFGVLAGAVIGLLAGLIGHRPLVGAGIGAGVGLLMTVISLAYSDDKFTLIVASSYVPAGLLVGLIASLAAGALFSPDRLR